MQKKTQLPRRFFRAGDVIFKEGEASQSAFLIESGQVEIFTVQDGKHETLNHLADGHVFGELSVLDDNIRSASAKAVTDTLVTMISKDQIRARLSSADPVLRLFFDALMGHFRTEVGHRQDRQLPDQPKAAQPSKELADLVRMESELALAIENQQLYLNFQPIVELESGHTDAAEVLIRWESPERGNVSPGVFMELAEVTELVVPITYWCIENGLKSLQKLDAQAHTPIRLSFNIDNRLIADESFLPWLVDQCQKHAISTSRVKLEILERSLVGDHAIEWIERCRENGFPMVLDDFGTGYASLAYLNKFSFDTLKLDQSFVRQILHSRSALNLCRSIVMLAEMQGLDIIAEGMESELEANLLRGMGCNFGQGYFYSRPLSFEQLQKYLAGQSASSVNT
ncbi:EAL domain-containing protein [Marinobacter sp. CHS3-4]|uniref:EAL domain-containing protein n=1 Tax=Marinobacter sp. CHS3-4 TaxID=3045174 RepID=UPI0024B56C9E|nr:EAL domain-containing protein [Marinobacter sp. CHS3-4]MDI9244681.1 EAL domain-containing protein [Marinobacter sp. CHS3-4]